MPASSRIIRTESAGSQSNPGAKHWASVHALPSEKALTIFTDHLQLSLHALAILLTNVGGQFTLPDVEMNSHEAPVPLANAVVFCPTRPPCVLSAATVLNFA